MKPIYLFLFLNLGASVAHASGVCAFGGSGLRRVVTQDDFNRTWESAKEYCAEFIHRTPDFEEVHIKARAGIRLEGHLQTELIFCRKNVGQEVVCNSQVIWKKDEPRVEYKSFKSCGNYDFDVKINADKSKTVDVHYDSPARGGYGSHMEGYYKLVEEKDGDVLVLERDYGRRLSAFIYGGHGISDLDCNAVFVDGKL